MYQSYFSGKGIMRKSWWIKYHKKCFKLESSFRAATKLRHELPTDIEMESIPLEELSSLVEDIRLKTQEALQNTDLDMR